MTTQPNLLVHGPMAIGVGDIVSYTCSHWSDSPTAGGAAGSPPRVSSTLRVGSSGRTVRRLAARRALHPVLVSLRVWAHLVGQSDG
jgi:hypothetical protein